MALGWVNATFVKVFRSPNFSLGEPTPKINLGLLIPRLRAFILNEGGIDWVGWGFVSYVSRDCELRAIGLVLSRWLLVSSNRASAD
ncbi:hypothetical protein PN36_26990 [Candidatus Thiomargarita nelsonii]|uniref:Uncharacterized protein n=1 Tax=Candidatus Thiomargarita nelsonii TaxID=1003181 RepID=A0A4E0QSS5_9GAMM|nr:hypothetical protein PN36_26990 [Candidatus Thiomargarita nelsonii]